MFNKVINNNKFSFDFNVSGTHCAVININTCTFGR